MPTSAEDRARYSEAIVSSPSVKKLIVAGPGTGKTFTFRQALIAAGGRGLALTFINNLVRDLKAELEDIADAYTFHGFCKYRFHQSRVNGLTPQFNYYPPIMRLIAQDMKYADRADIDEREIDRCLHNLDDNEGIIAEILRIGNYYDTVGHTDSVYRMFRHWEINPSEIPPYPLVVVDEYQDFSLLETQFIDLLARTSRVLIAGDDDQALYGFKHASASFIRTLAQNDAYEKFELPYCSRCTEVIINAVHDVLAQAHSQGLLAERLPKPYLYYPPDKTEDSRNHPQITHAKCTVERRSAPYVGKYVAARISEITEEEILASREGGYPAVLVTGPVEFVRRAHSVLVEQFPNAILKESSSIDISILDGYRYLSRNIASRLGWRIVLHVDPCEDIAEMIRTAYNTGSELSDLITDNYRERHIRVIVLIGKILDGTNLTEVEVSILELAIGLPLDSIKQTLSRLHEENAGADMEAQEEEENLEPTIICTSLLGSKGLSASRVFIVGFNNGHFPRNPSNITEDVVCCLLVGLSRTIKKCYLVSCGRFGSIQLQPSIFLNWIRTRCATERIDRNWIQNNAT